MFLIALIIFGFAYLSFIPFRLAVQHPVKTVRYAVIDTHIYFKEKKYNTCPSGSIVAYVSLTEKVFGNGKTLSAVHDVCSKYKRYNHKPVWCSERKRFVRQEIHIISNVVLNDVPYEHMSSLEQVVLAAYRFKEVDLQNDTSTVILVLIDEAAAQLNSRNFKTNINPLFLNTLVTSRHYSISLCYTSQRFSMVDALMRQVTSCVIACDKLWRFQKQFSYDAFEMENATTPAILRPIHCGGFFVCNSDYWAYNTRAVVDNLKKSFDEKDMMSEQEILALQCNNGANVDAIEKPSRKYMKFRQKYKK